MNTFVKKTRGIVSLATRGFASSSGAIKIKLLPADGFNLEGRKLPTETETNAEELLHYFKEMSMMRRMEIALDNLYKAREIRGFCHLYDGQESIAMGIEAGVTFEDCLITAYRDHCQAYCRGDSVHQIIAELMGKRTGSTNGKGGSMHFYRKKTNFYGGHGIVGAQCALGTGLAFALKYQQKPNVAITMYGDGAANQGQLFEAANMAALWKLPVIYVCENNHYAMGTSTARGAASTEYYKRLAPVPGIRFAANNVFAVREVTKFAKEYSIKEGPICLEMQTYRYHGHSMSDPGVTYRKKTEIDEYRKTKDCITLVKQLIIDNKVATEDDLKDIERTIKKEVDETVEKVRADPYPDEKDLTKDVYINEGSQPQPIRGVEYINSFLPNGFP